MTSDTARPDSGTAPPPSAENPAYINEDPAYRVFVDTLSYLEPSEIDVIVDAYRFSEKAHQGQKRLSGEPYITHPLAVAGALAEWQMDAQAPAPRIADPSAAPNVPVEKALEPITERGPKLHQAGEEGYR